jgi:hypothetical protein
MRNALRFRINICLVTVLVTFAFATTMPVAAADAYGVIADRNVFRLATISTTATNAVAGSPSADLRLTAIATSDGKARAYFVNRLEHSNPFMNLAEGEREGAVELIKILAADACVVARCDGREIVLSLNSGEGEGAASKAVAFEGNDPEPGARSQTPPNATGYSARHQNMFGQGIGQRRR